MWNKLVVQQCSEPSLLLERLQRWILSLCVAKGRQGKEGETALRRKGG